jgi:hypothetical protein
MGDKAINCAVDNKGLAGTHIVKRERPTENHRKALKTLGGRLVTLRRKRGYVTGSEAARAVGLQVRPYLAIERGSRNIPIAVLLDVLERFDATLAELAVQEPSQPNKPGGRPKKK